ncbi:multiple epidermal growth factor-like domains protein 8 [Anabrus simplex]|uniref:multiple epidermal growth factor-like domains protein 8 n=1 Tax=Anabrus simplex TaxID=316456 RepID=UPI0035A305BC
MRPGVKKKLGYGGTSYFLVFVLSVLCWFYLVAENAAAVQQSPCDKSRKVFNTSWGVITDGPLGSNYTQDSHCEWLIKANNSRQFITLTFRAMGTECSYDYVFVYDGDSFTSPLLGSFSGKTAPQQVTAASGAMLILLYSDTNYVLDGFQAEFVVTSCPNNCSSHGTCADHICVCDEGWGGKDCSRELCPEHCGNGTCTAGNKCVCDPGYSGQACSLHRGDTVGNRWHWLSHSETGLTPRAAHSAVYLNELDSLFVFGGYDLNHVLGDLVVYRFNTSHWEDEQGNVLDDGSSTKLLNPQQLLAALWEQVGEKRWSVRPKTSFFGNILLAIADNSTQSFRHQTGSDNSNHLRVGRHARKGLRLRSRRETPDDGELDPLERHRSLSELEDRGIEVDHVQTTTESDVAQEEDLAESVYEVFHTEEATGMPREMETEDRLIPSRPAARYGHAACSYPGGFVLHGGKLENGSLSDELWFYNATGKQWSLRAQSSTVRPPQLTRHTLTRIGKSDVLYLFGGSTLGGEFSSRLFRIRLNQDNPSEEHWVEVQPRGGKELDLRVVAHSTVYHARTNSLLVYGGVLASVARFSKLSDRMFSFQLDSKHWSEIHYPRAHLRDTYVPRERAFHTSTIIGNYLVVFGGYSHRHNKEEICYDNHMYLYHLGCHTWVSHEILGNVEKGHEYRYPKQQGVFAHAADVRGGNTLLIVGGYHGNVNSDLLAYTLPPMLASRDGETFEPEQICNRHHSLMECTANPECGWCSADEVCYGRTVGINCTTNLQTTRCPGVCPALGDCHSCLIHGNASVGLARVAGTEQVSSVANKLRLDHCTWCVQNARCHHKDDNFGVCGLREDTPSQVPGWWGPKGTEVVKVEECRILDRRPGLTFIKYRHPANWSQPDSVAIINATTVDFNIPSLTTRTEQSLGGEIIARLLGFLRPPETWQETHETLRMCASYSSATLSLSRGESQSELEVVANLTTESSQCVGAILPSGEPAILMPGRYLVDFESHNTVSFGPYITHQQSKMELLHNRSQENAKVFTFEYLEPYENGSCHLYTNCLHCLTDSLCGWCDLNSRCLLRSLNEMEVCTSPGKPDDWHYLTLLPSRCANCSNYISCETCVGSSLCEWWIEDARCARRGRFADAVMDLAQCPVPCHQRSNCSQCLDDRGRCVWCEATEECFSFSVYTSEYQFGLCREWVDQVYYSSGFPSASPHQQRGSVGGKAALLAGNEQCKSCSRHLNCSSCLRTLSCGWCYSASNPITGVCVQGDFNHARVDSCSVAINAAHDTDLGPSDASWAYAECPDVDECNLELDNCHEFAECTNTRGSFSCQCKRGYSGDGIHTCAKTCYHDCVHGWCVGAPVYACKCEIGWTGDDCSINCGCNNHSTCTKGVGICDECRNWTMGEHCEECRPGSFGNATTSQGCQSCNCNDHGNVEKDICDPQTGVCFCQDNTEGVTCDKCKKGYYGDPRHGGMCYYQCVSRGMLSGIEPQGLGSRLGLMTPWELRQGGPPTRECLWIVSPYDMQNKSLTQESTSSLIQFTIHDDININCEENSVYVYDGLPDFVSSNTGHQSHVLGIFCSMDTQYPATVEAKSGVLTVYYKQGDLSEGFNSSYTVLTCPEKCTGNHVCRSGQCVCKEGLTGANCSFTMCHNNCSSDKKQGICDKAYGRCLCSSGFGGDDCSVQLYESQLVFTQLFDSTKLADSLEHLRKTLPRFGHSLVADRRGSLWMFGGFSLSHGPLNDVRLFDTKNNTWMPVTIDSTRDTNMPQGRYFHAAEISHSRQEIYVYGGLTEKDHYVGLRNNTLNDFWKFSLKNSRWIEILPNKREFPPLAGHSLTLHREGDSESLLLVGGFSPRYGFLDTVWEFNLETEIWEILNTTGNGPAGVYGHSTVYHNPTQSFYVYGGYMYWINHTFISNKLYVFHYPTKFWSLLPAFEENNPAEQFLPRARFLHSAVTTDDFMLIFGGRTHPQNTSDSLVAYSYSCNQWIRLINKDVEIVGTPPPPTYSQAMTLDLETGAAYIIGGFDGGIQNHVTRITLPHDLCSLWSSRDKCSSFLGCSFCDVYREDGSNSTYCYSNSKGMLESCENQVGIIVNDNGVMCNASWLAKRHCEQFTSCTECLAKWPSYLQEQEVCKWCANCPKGHCISADADCDKDNKCGTKQKGLSNVSECAESQCSSSDCEKCMEIGSCVWTRQVLRLPDLGVKVTAEPIFDWNCVMDDVADRSAIKKRSMPLPVCPPRCSEYNDCKSCLEAPGAEGGWHECRWSVKLNECISPSYQPLYCAGGVCGLVLTKEKKDHCPERCSSFKQCSTCLSHTHCGWCSVQVDNSTGYGICTEGSLDSPSDGPAHSSCSNLYYQQEAAAFADDDSRNSSPSPTLRWDSPSRQEPTFSWHYVRCPPENECLNNHHTCDNKSEKCVDVEDGFLCICGRGYKSDKSACVPMCTQGCVRGVCVEPDKCQCDFGYVGANCSIQCQCNGHANCAGPDKLDVCLGCHNNTMGPQCDRCKPLFVGDPTNGGECVPCIEYCYGHTHICINDTIPSYPPLSELSRADLESLLLEGPTTRARCLDCRNRTAGDKCEDCIPGNFRINQDKRTACRPCECHGHGDMCDATTGEGCVCHNNTESDPTCNSNNKGTSQCWMHQCSKCKESYMGTPTNGHQCYRQMTVDSKFCFDAKQLEECQMKPNPLESGHSVFFVVQPRFMNVDIRVIVDVTQGALDLFLSPLEDTFVVTVNASNGDRKVEVDPKYQKRSEDQIFAGEVPIRMSPMELVSSETEVTLLNGSSSTTDHSSWSLPQVYVMIERGAHGLTTFVTVPRRNTFLIVRNLQDRLVLTLPQDRHELGSTKFYMALTATVSSYGMIFFRQDQLHIDLFVFFSVFFSCFFLFLAACVVAWKAKQAADVRRARRRHVVEMLHMAKRPFATVTLLLDTPSEPDDQLIFVPTSSTQSPHRKKQRKQHLQGGGDIRPVAVEPTDDGIAAVGTVFVQLPGGTEAPVRLALASSLILLARVYPLNGRAFLRRRSSHAPS